ncbi:hypothetical protein H2200_010076 [Cladophialophora chaetospira]|uniref:Uncharacterized protein n=1 Tax=Cladophialophora chaetospira TaxID=386627 RepID=A0AA39CEN6_9EURO|nr:hypothetical protein H2200_010076 [Cladophialophora chaetospira]
MALYIDSNIALEGLAYGWAAEFGRSRGVNVNGKLLPAYIEGLATPYSVSISNVSVVSVPTDLISEMPEEQQDIIRNENAAKAAAAPRVGEPDDVAQVVAFLASESSKRVTGSTISANGGTIII